MQRCEGDKHRKCDLLQVCMYSWCTSGVQIAAAARNATNSVACTQYVFGTRLDHLNACLKDLGQEHHLASGNSALQVVQEDKVDILALQGGTASTVPAAVLDIARQVPTSVLIWRDLEARAAQLRNMKVAEIADSEA